MKNTNKDNSAEQPNNLDRRDFIVGTVTTVAITAGALGCDAPVEEPLKDVPKVEAPPKEVPKAEAPQKEAPKADPPPKEVPKPKNTGHGRIVMVTHPGATTDVKKTHKDVVKLMVERALTEFTGDADGVTALSKFFKKEDVVGIKVNCLGAPYATVHPSTAFALADTLNAIGIPKKNIYIYDQYGSRMRKAGFKLSLPKGTPEGQYPVHYHDTLGYASKPVNTGGFFKNGKIGSSRMPRILDRLTAVLNVCCVKDHDLTGITGALKNVSYGNVERVPVYHCTPDCNPTCKHDGLCNVSRIYKHDKMGGLVRLVVCDALRVLYQGGPQDNMTYKKAHNAIMVSTDPVAIDSACLEIVNGYRKERNLKPIENDRGGRRAPRFLEAANKLGLGEHDLSKVKWDKITMG